MKWILVVALLWVACPAVGAGLEGLDRLADAAGSGAESLPALLFEMAAEPERSTAVLDAADLSYRALSDTLVSLLSMTEPEARGLISGLHEVRDFGPGPGDRPPIWSDLQWQGVQLARRIVIDPTNGRDLRLRRQLDEAIAGMDRPQPAAVAGVVLLLEQWFAERGEDVGLTHDPARIPDVLPWMERLAAGDLPAPQWIAALDANPRRREAVIRRLDATTDAYLTAELMETLAMLPEDFAAAGIEAARYDPATARFVGHRTVDLWRLTLRLLDVVSGEPASGVDDDAVTVRRTLWWRGARYEARFWRDPNDAPDFAEWLEAPTRSESDGGPSTPEWVRSIFIAENQRDRIVGRLGEEHAPRVADLIALLRQDREGAFAMGFRFAYYRPDLSRTPGGPGLLTGIRWDRAQEMIRGMLRSITSDPGLEGSGLDDAALNAHWQSWWRVHSAEARWSFDGASSTDPLGGVTPERARID